MQPTISATDFIQSILDAGAKGIKLTTSHQQILRHKAVRTLISFKIIVRDNDLIRPSSALNVQSWIKHLSQPHYLPALKKIVRNLRFPEQQS